MPELIPRLLPFLLVDALNPVLFALMVVAVGSARPALNSGALLAGHTAAYFVSGIAVAFGMEQLATRLANPGPVEFGVELLLGGLCVWAALASRGGKASEERRPESELSPGVCFGYGAIINFIGVPFAVPYFAAIDQILMADLPFGPSLAALAIYNIAYALPFLLVPVLALAMGANARPVLETINDFLVKATDLLVPPLLFLLGVALLVDSIGYFIMGRALW